MNKFILLVFALISLNACTSHEILSSAKKTDLIFNHSGFKMAGTLVTPEGGKSFPVVLFVHGDGPTDRFSQGGANHVINTFLGKGIAFFAWDKQGVGESEGNWLDQSMSMRADEAISAMDFLSKRADIDKRNIGFLGVSQGGWVLPKIATKTDKPAFYIIQGGAINWLRQNYYFVRQRLKTREGITDSKMIQEVLDYEIKHTQVLLEKLPHVDYITKLEGITRPKGALGPIKNKDRYEFVIKNIETDTSKDLSSLTSPLLAIWGEDDLNVDAAYNYTTYKNILFKSQHTDFRLQMFENATHALAIVDPIIKTEKYNL